MYDIVGAECWKVTGWRPWQQYLCFFNFRRNMGYVVLPGYKLVHPNTREFCYRDAMYSSIINLQNLISVKYFYREF